MAGQGFTVDLQKLESSSRVISEKAGAFQAEYKKIYDAVENLKIQWKGIASETFNTTIKAYEKDFVDMYNILKEYSSFLVNTAGKKYQENENKLTEEANRLPKSK